VGESPVSSGEAAPQIESPQNRHLDLLLLSQLSTSISHLSKSAGLQQKHRQTTRTSAPFSHASRRQRE
jgi:hypothetical protein